MMQLTPMLLRSTVALAAILAALLVVPHVATATESAPDLGSAAEGAAADRFSVFSAGGPTHAQVWGTDGTAAGTGLVKPISHDADPRFFAPLGPRAYFAATDEGTGRELWRTNGTTDGTRLLSDIRPGEQSSRPSGMTVKGRRFYFAATTGAQGDELWRSDGTRKGTVLLKNIRRGGRSSTPEWFTRAGKYVFFVARNGYGRQVWRTDGTRSGTRRLTDFPKAPSLCSCGWPNRPAGNPAMKAAGGLLYFIAGPEAPADELWRSDGTAAGTFRVKDLDRIPREMFEIDDVDGTAVFRAMHKERGPELWRTRGTKASTAVLTNIPGTDPQDDQPSAVCGTLGSNGYFVAHSTLYRTQGTAATTDALFSPAFAGLYNGHSLCEWDRYANALFPPVKEYSEGDASEGDENPDELWRTDGTPEGTRLLASIPGMYHQIYDIEPSGGLLYFTTGLRAYGPGDEDLWRSDGTQEGTYRVDRIGWKAVLEEMTAVGP